MNGGPANGWITEAKWTGNERQWSSSPYSTTHDLYHEDQIPIQANKLLDLYDGLGGSGVRYAASNLEGAQHFANVFAGNARLAEAMASGSLGVFHVPGNGMRG
ncbi:hypothetical protein GCM10022227_24740 [Streptomyces sedi]